MVVPRPRTAQDVQSPVFSGLPRVCCECRRASLGTASVNQTRRDVLNGWKEIAAYLGRDPRTVERWEKQRSLPVRRLPGSGRATVYALVPELDEWLASSPREPAPVLPVGEIPEPAQVRLPENGADPTANTAQQVDAPPQQTAETERRRSLWLRWVTPVTVLLLIGSVGLTAAAWKRRHMEARPSTLPSPARLHKLVPSSAVYGVEELYLRGCYQTELRTPESLHRAQDAFKAAIVRDPHYAPAYAGLANTYLLLREYSVLPDAEAYAQAIDAAQQAMKLNPDLPQAHTAIGFVDFFWRWDSASSERHFRRALELDPDLPLAHHWYGSVLAHEGKIRESVAELNVAQRLDPSSSAILTTRALALGIGGHRAEATDLLQEALSSDVSGRYRNPVTMHSVLGILSLYPPRDIPRYLAETTLAAELRQDTATAKTMQMAATVYRAHGEQAMWRALLAEERTRQGNGGPTYSMARYEAELGDKEQSLNDLADLFSRHDPGLIGISIDPLFSGLHNEPRFQQLRVRMGLPAVEDEQH